MGQDKPRRFYGSVSVATLDGRDGWGVFLDQRPIRTPGRATLALPTKALADAVAAEWQDQAEQIDLAAMTLTRLSNVALDRTPMMRGEMIDELANYAQTDLTCHLEPSDSALRALQEQAWRPWRHWVGRTLDVVLVPVEGIMATAQPPASLETLRYYASALDDFRLTGLNWACSLFGSVVLACAVEQDALEASEALRLSCIDEDWQAKHWGQDSEAQHARAGRERDAVALGVWLGALSI